MTPPYNDTDLVYVDPEKRIVVGPVEFAKNGNAKPLEMPSDRPVFEVGEDDAGKEKDKKPAAKGAKPDRPHRKPRKRFYPWGTYKTMKKIYRLEGREPPVEHNITLDQAIEKSSKEPFWDNETKEPAAVSEEEKTE